MQIIGRKEEIKYLAVLLEKSEPEFVAVYGRRRVGKTHLVREVYKKNIVFECSGLHEKSLAQQLENFWLTLHEYDQSGKVSPQPKTWLQAFSQLKTYLNALQSDEKKVVFLDETPWFETPRAGFLAALDNFWNQYCTKRSDLILVICGSAASWIINKVINDKGGLHNRVTRHVQLMAFTLLETRMFLESRGVHLTNKDIALLYMCVGGIPFYLRDVEPGKSVPQILDKLFFGKQASLRNEFLNLYAALFKNSSVHETVVGALSTKNKGLTRSEIIQSTGLKSGGGLSLAINELIACGFVQQVFPIHKSKSESLFRLMDEFTLFHFNFMANSQTNSSWLLMASQPNFKTWSGYAFEGLCLKHTLPIKKALGIHGIISNEYAWSKKKSDTLAGAQIDFIIDRTDNCINLFEIKFHDTAFEMTGQYAEQLRRKIHVFKTDTRTKKNVFLTLLTAYGASQNKHFLSVVTNQMTVEDLFL